MNPAAIPNELLTLLTRMVVPLRREFGRDLDVQDFLHDSQYAHSILNLARSSGDPRLRLYAEHAHGLRPGGPRLSAPSPAFPASAPGAAAGPATPDAPPRPGSPEEREAQLRAQLMRKYVGGLR